MRSPLVGLFTRGNSGGSARMRTLALLFRAGVERLASPASKRTPAVGRLPVPVPFWVVLLLPLLSGAGPALSGQDVGYGVYTPPTEVYADEPVYGSRFAPYDRGMAGYGVEPYAPAGFPDRDRDAYQAGSYPAPGPAAYLGRMRESGHGLYPVPGQDLPYGREDARRPDEGRDRGGVSSSGRSDPWGLPPEAVRGFRFRGDRPSGSGNRVGFAGRGGYRFRPLTEQELERIDNVSEWRPREHERWGERPGQPDPLSAEEAYGYESENWFQRYYRDRY